MLNIISDGLGRRSDPDPRDLDYPLRLAGPSMIPTLLPSVVYRRGKNRNQGATATCVGHGWRAFMDGAPLMTTLGPTPFEIYDGATQRDPWPDNDHDAYRQSGTSVRAGAQELQARGHIANYLWAFNLQQVREWVLTGRGGVVLGVNWYRYMSDPDVDGIIRIGGRIDGGHCLYLFGMDEKSGMALLQNSWGEDWGGWRHPKSKVQVYKGCARIPYEDLERLLRENGEACTAVEQKVKKAT